MIQCQNCGQVNAQASNFCRFCGTKFSYNQMPKSVNFEQAPPRPYSWKTDEFQVTEKPRPKAKQINQVQPLGRQNAPFTFQPPQQPQPLVYQAPQQNIAYSAHCPRCASQLFRYERKISNAGWIVFAVLLVTFFPLFWIGFLMKEDVRICQICNQRLS